MTRWLLALVLLVHTAYAQPASEADRLFEEGRTFAERGEHASACTRFAESYQLDPAVGTKLNLGDCHEHLGKLQDALRLFEEAAAELERQGEAKRARFARQRASAVMGKLVVVIVKPAEPARGGLSVQIAGREIVAANEMRVIVEPGTIPIVASVPGRPPFSTSVTSTGGATVTVEIPPFGGDVPPPPREETRRSRARIKLVWGLGAGGAASAITAGVLTLKARSDYNTIADSAHCTRITGGITCDPTGEASIRDAQRLADVGTVFAVGSVALIAAGVILYVTAPEERVVVAPVITSDTAAIVGRVTF